MCGAHTVVLYCDGDFNWLGQVFGGGGDLTPPWRSGGPELKKKNIKREIKLTYNLHIKNVGEEKYTQN